MPLTLKLVGKTSDNKQLQIKDNFIGTINLNLLQGLFKFFGINEEDLSQIKFIINADEIKDSTQSYTINVDEEKTIFVFTRNSDIRDRLIFVFTKNGSEITNTNADPGSTTMSTTMTMTTSMSTTEVSETKVMDPDIVKPMVVQSPKKKDDELTDEIVHAMNLKAMQLYSDPDFKTLLRIYQTKPDMFTTLLQYVQNGDMFEQSLVNVKTINDLSVEELAKYESIADQLAPLGLNISRELLINKLIKYNGHMNLTVRSIFCELL
jgi:hypothetical protein